MSFKISDKLTKTSSLPQEGIASFIRKTYELLEEKAHLDIVSWSDDGNYIVIKDLQKFTSKILPVYFKHNKMNSFIRQLNMYNFRKKRTMNSYHIYFNDLFKRGKFELLPLIKRKISDAPSSPILSHFNPTSHTYLSQDQDLAYENAMLKKINQKAMSKVNTLEAKIADLVHENKSLIRKISDRQKKEDYLHNAFSQCYPGNPQGFPNTYPSYPPMHNGPVLPEEFKYQPFNPYAQGYVKPPMARILTPETNDTTSSETFIARYENEATSSGEFSESIENSPQHEIPSSGYEFYDDMDILGKRKFSKNVGSINDDEDFSLFHCEPFKVPCSEPFEEVESRRINLIDSEFPIFSEIIGDAF